MPTQTSRGNLAPNVQRPPRRLKTFKKRELHKPMAHKRGFNTCCKLCGVIYHNIRYCLADPADAHKKQETCWLENDLNMQ